jgi:hypothetical protein
VAFSGEESFALFVERICDALDLIGRTDSRWLQRILRNLSSFALVADGGEYFDPGLRTYVVDLKVLMARSVEEVAMTIVHEATHARLRRLHVRSTPANVARIEKLCVDQEVALAARLPDSDKWIARATAKLERPWWGSDQLARRIEAQLRTYGFPEWLIRLRTWLAGARGSG